MKKLFKLSLVLCASILMAISCSSKQDGTTNDPGNNPNNPGGTTKEDMTVSITKGTKKDALTLTAAASETKTDAEVGLKFTKPDAKSVTISVDSVVGLAQTEIGNSTTDLSEAQLNKAHYSYGEDGKIAITKEGNADLKKVLVDNQKKGGVKVTLKFVAEGYNDYTQDLYILVTGY